MTWHVDDTRRALPTLAALRWRTDVTIGSDQAARILRPVIVMELSLSNGERRTFELSKDQFEMMRFKTTRALAEVQQVESLQILKID